MILIVAILCFKSFGQPLPAQEESSPLWQKIEDARVYMSSNKYQDARAMFEQALGMAVKEKDQAAEAICIGNLGTLCEMTDNVDEAIHYYKKGYELAEKQHNHVLCAKFAGCLLRKYAQKGDLRKARKWLEMEEAVLPADDPRAKFDFLYNKANVLYLENDPVLSLHYLDKAQRWAEENNLGAETVGAALMAAGDILYKTKRYREAIETYLQGFDQIKKGGSRVQEIFAFRSLYVAYKQIGDSTMARKYREKYNMVTDSVYDGLDAAPAEKRLKDFEKNQNAVFQESSFNQSFFLICIIIVLLGIVAFGAVAIHRLARHQKTLLDSSGIIMMSAAASASETPHRPSATSEGKEEHAGTDGTGPGEGEGASPDEENTAAESSDSGKETPGSPILTYEQQKTLLEKINLVMENVSLICREDFNLAMLAKAVGSNTKYVSKVINDLCGKTFKTYLNEYRIREACHRLTDKENFGNLTIKAIHQELGFRTTTSFVAAFRKVMGMTPSEYKKQHGDLSSDDSSGEELPSEESDL
ncbi:MAG: AraC family transcriptional regulator [Muribaculaceae bacterium]|nr:AraC family transcriptional regulator [Muribaculaceae bacterium]